jgi:hypothetical protein
MIHLLLPCILIEPLATRWSKPRQYSVALALSQLRDAAFRIRIGNVTQVEAEQHYYAMLKQPDGGIT